MISARGSLARRALVGTLDLLVPAPAPALITMPIPAPSADGRSPAQVRCEVTAAGCFDATDHTARVARPMPTPAVIRRERRGAFAGREPISVVATRPAAVPAAGCSCIAPVAAAASAAPRPSGAAATADTPARNPARRVKRPIRMSGNARSRDDASDRPAGPGLRSHGRKLPFTWVFRCLKVAVNSGVCVTNMTSQLAQIRTATHPPPIVRGSFWEPQLAPWASSRPLSVTARSVVSWGSSPAAIETMAVATPSGSSGPVLAP
jgi:hypothetical protein